MKCQPLAARKGFTLVEVIACTVILVMVVIGATLVSRQISVMKTESRNTVYMSLHNLNVMERLRQMSYDLQTGEELLAYYSSDTFGTSEFTTDVYVQMSTWDSFKVYSVRIETRMQGYTQLLISTYTMTNIGGYHRIEDINGTDVDEGIVILS